ncbi:MAG: uroporphyrinogen-III C-methyltransferase [Rhodocyclaceae bacterium]|nr:MAG: uroporphyrinogen-III C-methyltransferase [Rhodocyclaceae bacterium]
MIPPRASSLPGTVYLVGSGPGDPELMTLKAARLVREADVIVYDHLGAENVLDLARPEAEKIYAGKEASNHALPQEEINVLLVRLAKEGKRVVRLKGGDPFIFGRGGEEIETLAEHGVPFEVVPGVTAASGCGSYAGIPLTHRDHSQICVFATGHLKDGSVNLDWKALARPNQTVVFYMGIGGADEICRQLMENGLPADHPAAVVQHGTSRRQRVLTATLGTLAAEIDKSDIRPPALIIIGTVVTLQSRLAWFKPNAS